MLCPYRRQVRKELKLDIFCRIQRIKKSQIRSVERYHVLAYFAKLRDRTRALSEKIRPFYRVNLQISTVAYSTAMSTFLLQSSR